MLPQPRGGPQKRARLRKAGGRGEGPAVEYGRGRARQALLCLSSLGGPDKPLLLDGVQGGVRPSPCPAQARLLSLGTSVTQEGQSGQRMARAAWHRDPAPPRGEAGSLHREARCSWPLALQLRGVGGHLQAGSTQAPCMGAPASRCGLGCISLMGHCVGRLFCCCLALRVSSWRDVYSGPLPIFKLGWLLINELSELFVSPGY